MKSIKIKGEEYTPKYTLRALFIYEQISGHNGFETSNTEDNFKLIYAMLKGSKRDSMLTYDEFIDECDANPEMVAELTECITTQVKANDAMMEKAPEGTEAKKK